MKPNKPANTPDTGPVRSKRKRPVPKGGPTKSGGIFGNAYKKSRKK